MGSVFRTCIIGDLHPDVDGHVAIAAALSHSAAALDLRVESVWMPTHALSDDIESQLAGFHAIWCGPWGPYQNVAGALRAIRLARETGLPFLGTCAGFQHAVVEFARNVLGFADADHAEQNPSGERQVIGPLAHPLLERTAAVVLDPASQSAGIYQRTALAEWYRCNFGLNPMYLAPLHRAGLRTAGVDEEGVVSILELASHPFFVATLFMPERASRPHAPHPLVTAFVRASASTASPLQLA